MSSGGKLITIIPKRPNPLFEDFLNEFIREASGVEKTDLKNALSSLKKYPILLSKADDCFILEHFTRDLCERLDIRWKRHLQASVNADYIPLLVWIYDKERKPDYKGFLTVEDVSEFSGKNQSVETHVFLLQSVLQNYIYIENDRYRLTTPGRELAQKHSNKKRPNENGKVANDPAVSAVENATSVADGLSVMAPTKRTRKKPTKAQNGNDVPSSQNVVESQITNTQPNSQNVAENVEKLLFLPGTFIIILLIDTAETTSEASKTTITKVLTEMGVPHEIRHLNVGDYLWIAKDQNGKELVLPYIAERKRLDDFFHSIKDGRYHEQKHRLKESKHNVIYIIEKCKLRTAMSEETLTQASINTLVNDKFHIKETNNLKETIVHLGNLTNILTQIFSSTVLSSCSKESFENTIIETNSDFHSLQTYNGFIQGMSKSRNYTVKEMFIKHLIQLSGVSVEKAAAIVDVYPTPNALMRALRDNSDVIANIPFGHLKRKIGYKISKIIHAFYTKTTFPV